MVGVCRVAYSTQPTGQEPFPSRLEDVRNIGIIAHVDAVRLDTKHKSSMSLN
jgi:hypothetical protein